MYWFQRLEVFNCIDAERTASSLWLRFQNSRFLPATEHRISDCLSSQVDSAGKNRCRVSWLGFCSITVRCFVSGKPTLCVLSNGKTHLNNLQVFSLISVRFLTVVYHQPFVTWQHYLQLFCKHNLMKIRDFVPKKTRLQQH